MNYDHNIDDFAWYDVGNRRYYNKLEALFAHKHEKLPIHWNVNDTEYDRYDWSVEPNTSLTELYAQRARDIRNKYDYIVLHFSGGSDSANILETFIRNQIPLDEIITRGSYSQCAGITGAVSANAQYSECLNQALPLAEYARDKYYPNLKITVVETTNIINDYYTYNPDWAISGLVSGVTPAMILKSDIDILSNHYKKITDLGKKIVHIFGADKPKIFRNKNNFYTRWTDKVQQEFTASRSSSSQLPQYSECFYLGKNAVQLQIKQLHVVKNYIKQHNVQDAMFDPDAGRSTENFISNIIYNRTLPLFIEHEKDLGKSWIQARDYWFGTDINSNAYKNWYQGICHLTAQLPDWVNANGFKGLYSKPRYLGK